MSQTVIINKVVHYLNILHRGGNDVALRTDGWCHGFSICWAAMHSINQGLFWESLLKTLANHKFFYCDPIIVDLIDALEEKNFDVEMHALDQVPDLEFPETKRIRTASP